MKISLEQGDVWLTFLVEQVSKHMRLKIKHMVQQKLPNHCKIIIPHTKNHSLCLETKSKEEIVQKAF